VEFSGRRIAKPRPGVAAAGGGARRRGGRPRPPRTDEGLEPIRALLEGKIPAVVDVSTPAHVREVLKLFLEDNKIPVVLLNAEGSYPYADRLSKEKVGVILPLDFIRDRPEWDFHQGDHLARQGVPIAFQSAAEDGARDLPFHVLHAVERGLSADAALAALTIDAAKMYKIDDRVGAIEPDKDADLVIFSGHPFLGGGRAERVFVRGEEVKP
jgi:imidazolonepropionase-like amidohydrolase